MRISALKFLGHNDTEPTIYRFASKAGGRSNFFCHLGHPENIKNVIKALQCCLSREPQSNTMFRSIHLQLNDESGNVWTIEQKGSSRKFYQNDKPVEGDINQTQLGALLDWDTGETSAMSRGDDPFRIFELAVKSGEISAVATAAPLSGAGGAARVTLEKSRELNQLMQSRYNPAPQLAPGEVVPMVDQMIELNFKWQQIHNLAKAAKGELGFAKVDPAAVEQLEKEIALIEKIRKLADPLLDPANTLSNIKDKLTQTEERMAAIAGKLGVDYEQKEVNQINWDELIKYFTKYKAKEIIIREMGATTSRIKMEIDPIVEEITETIAGLLDNDTQVISELKDCLRRVRKIQAPTAEPEARGLFARLRGKGRNSDAGETRIKDEPSVIIGSDELAIEYGLARLSELRLSLARIRPIVDKSMTSLNNYYEKLAREHGKTRAEFEQYIKDNALPQLSDMKQIYAFLSLHAELCHLKTMRDQLAQQLENNKVAFRELEEMIQKWRALSGSQKATSLDRYSLILAEARGIIAFLDQKTGRLEKLRKTIIQNGVIQTLFKQFKNSLSELDTQWEELQRGLGLTPLGIDDPNLSDFFKKVQEIKPFVAQPGRQAAAFYGAQIFSGATLDSPLTVFVLTHENLNNTLRIRLLEYLEQAPPSGLGILMTSDAVLTEMVQRIGISPSVTVKPKPKAAEPPTQGELLSKRAEDVLRLLTNNKPAVKPVALPREKR